MTLDDETRGRIAQALAAIAAEAGVLLRRMERGVTGEHLKADGSPCSDADLAAERLIVARLGEAWPDIPVVAEETSNAGSPGRLFFLVDPLDGTSDYLLGTGEYSVNVALVAEGRPVAAAVAAPARGRVWSAGSDARVADYDAADPPAAFAWGPARTRAAPLDGLVALVSRRHGDTATEDCLATLSIGTRRTASSALKFCLIASGEADVYVRCGPTMEWDTAAGDHILTRAGGAVIGPGGAPLSYGQDGRGYRNGPFAALGDVTLAPRLSLPSVAAA